MWLTSIEKQRKLYNGTIKSTFIQGKGKRRAARGTARVWCGLWLDCEAWVCFEQGKTSANVLFRQKQTAKSGRAEVLEAVVAQCQPASFNEVLRVGNILMIKSLCLMNFIFIPI